MFSKLFKKQQEDQRSTAHLLNYNGKGSYIKSFDKSNFGVVFEDDGETGYLYATDKNHKNIYDALQLYNYGDNNHPKLGETIFIIFNEALKKVGFYYKDKFHAVLDFKNERGSNLLNTPILETAIWKKSHAWGANVIDGLQPQ